jgi:hypothetical protein
MRVADLARGIRVRHHSHDVSYCRLGARQVEPLQQASRLQRAHGGRNATG